MTIEELKRPERLDEDRIEALKALFPDAFPDGHFDVQTLKELLESPAESPVEGGEFYGLNWSGKRQARKLAVKPSEGTLAPMSGEGVKEESSKNIIIEGDNLEVMKTLLKAYAGRIKVIYIDPPYNTGKDFVYNDSYASDVRSYLLGTSQADLDGLLVSNPRLSGRFHANWLSMMLPRLRTARSLLREDGVIFVSIDDNEQHNLRLLLDEVFGGENFLAQFIWKSRQNKDNRTVTGASQDHEYIIAYGNRVYGDPRDENQYENPDNDPRGPWASANMVGLLPENERPNLHYDLENHKTGDIYTKPPMGWRYDKSTMRRLIDEDRILWPKKEGGRPRRKVFLKELSSDTAGISTVLDVDVFTRDGTSELESLFGERVLEFPKPTALIEKIIEQGFGNEDGMILDFFAGSGTTGQAVLQFNKKHKRNIEFILVQLEAAVPEGHAARDLGYDTISQITRNRIKRHIEQSGDTNAGFKAYKLAASNLRKWSAVTPSSLEALNGLDFSGSGVLVPNYKTQDVLTELMLLEGFPLDSRVEQSPDFDDVVHVVTHPERSYRLLVCLSTDTLMDGTVEAASRYSKDTFVCLESSLNDQLKLRLADAVENVKTL